MTTATDTPEVEKLQADNRALCQENAGLISEIEELRGRLAEARFGFALKLEERPLDWLRDPVGSAYLFDLATLPVCLDRVPKIICNSVELAERAASLLPLDERSRVVLADA